ncbi:AAA family ATPase [Spirosoma arcticum]
MATENPRVWFKSISLENVRSFGTKQTINFTDKDGNAARWNVILGDNGTGKTTALRGLFLAANEKYNLSRYAFDFYSLLRQDDLVANIIAETEEWSEKKTTRDALLTLFVSEEAEADYRADYRTHPVVYSGVNYVDGTPFNTLAQDEAKPTIYAYGASRRIGESGLSEDHEGSFITLFDDEESLINTEEWLVQADYIAYKNVNLRSRYDLVNKIILKVLREEVNDLRIDTSTGIPKVFLVTHYGDVRLHELSLGYKTLIAWMVDFAKGLLDHYPGSEDPLAEPAVCLVDEIDLHLHPKFQRSIIKFLTETFPNTQFIVTAHSPLIVQSAEDANIILLKREGNETHVAEGIDVHSWRIDQILSSDLFGGVSVLPPETETKMQRRRALLLKDERTNDENQELEHLEEELGMLTASESKEALKAFELIGKSLSQ